MYVVISYSCSLVVGISVSDYKKKREKIKEKQVDILIALKK